MKNNEINLKTTSAKKIFLAYVIPSIIAMITTNAAMLIDTIFIGHFVGPEGIAAITLIAPIIMIIASIAPMIGIGGSTLAGIYKGNNDYEKSNNFFNLTLSLIFIIGIVITLLLFFLHETIPKLLNISGNVALYASEYMYFVSFFVLGFLLPMTLSPFIKLEGKPITVVIIMAIGTITNIILDYLLIVVLDLGIKGAAIATGIGQIVPSIIFLVLIIKSKNWSLRKPEFRKKDIAEMLYNGSSEMLSMIAVSITGFVYNIIILKYLGEIGVSAYGIALQIFNLATVLFYGISDGIQSPISFNFGANQFNRVKSLRRIAINTGVAIGVLLAILTGFFGREVASLFVAHKQTIELTQYILKFYSLSFVVLGVNIVLTTYYTAINQPLISIIIALSRSVIVILVSLLVLPVIFGEIGLWIPIALTEYVTIIIALIFLVKRPFGKPIELK